MTNWICIVTKANPGNDCPHPFPVLKCFFLLGSLNFWDLSPFIYAFEIQPLPPLVFFKLDPPLHSHSFVL